MKLGEKCVQCELEDPSQTPTLQACFQRSIAILPLLNPISADIWQRQIFLTFRLERLGIFLWIFLHQWNLRMAIQQRQENGGNKLEGWNNHRIWQCPVMFLHFVAWSEHERQLVID